MVSVFICLSKVDIAMGESLRVGKCARLCEHGFVLGPMAFEWLYQTAPVADIDGTAVFCAKDVIDADGRGFPFHTATPSNSSIKSSAYASSSSLSDSRPDRYFDFDLSSSPSTVNG